jgi:hypothetical protein
MVSCSTQKKKDCIESSECKWIVGKGCIKLNKAEEKPNKKNKPEEKPNKKNKPEEKPIKKNSPINYTELKINILSKRIKNKVNNFIEALKKKKENKDYESYCKSLKPIDINKPIINIKMNVEFPIAKMNKFNINNPNQQFTFKKINGIKLEFNNYSLRHILYKSQPDNIKYIESLIDNEWLDKMNKYIINLSTKDIFTIRGYTSFAYYIVNNFLQGIYFSKFNYYPFIFQAINIIEKVKDFKSILTQNIDFMIIVGDYILIENDRIYDPSFNGKYKISEIFEKITTIKDLTMVTKFKLMFSICKYLSDNFWKDVINDYINDLNSIIDKSPVITKKMIVYRGVKDDYYLNGIKNHIYKTNTFVSTSINLPSALKFANSNCCLKRITLLPGSRALLLEGITVIPNEIELLIGTKSQFFITNNKNLISLSTKNMCNDNKDYRITVSDLVVIK